MDLGVRKLIRKISLRTLSVEHRVSMGNCSNWVSKVSPATVAKYMGRQQRPPSQSWRAFLNHHVQQLVATDFFVVSTVTFRVL